MALDQRGAGGRIDRRLLAWARTLKSDRDASSGHRSPIGAVIVDQGRTMSRLILMPLLGRVLSAGVAFGAPGSAKAMVFPSYSDVGGIRSASQQPREMW